MNKITRDDVIRQVSRSTRRPYVVVEEVINALSDTIVEGLSNGKSVQLNGLGTFEMKKWAERKGRIPREDKEVIIPARFVPKFKAGNRLKALIRPVESEVK